MQASSSTNPLGSPALDLMDSKSTKASTLMTGSTTSGTQLTQSNKTSFHGSSAASPKILPNSGKGIGNLDVIEEELQIEEGNENEFESHRNTIQKLRAASKGVDQREITENELSAANAGSEHDLAALKNEDQF